VAVWPYTTQRWQRLRRHKLRAHPLCEACLQVGLIEAAVAVDHRIPIKRGGDPFPHLDELAALCEGCHNAKTRAEQLGREPAPKVVKGCDVHGNPLDPNHDWYRTGT
jgi:5-methylcytosine-specific restriction protein A